jgi:hypothetical protein
VAASRVELAPRILLRDRHLFKHIKRIPFENLQWMAVKNARFVLPGVKELRMSRVGTPWSTGSDQPFVLVS